MIKLLLGSGPGERRWHPCGVPWCDGCSRFMNPNSLQPDGACPQCGGLVADPEKLKTMQDAPVKAPWHFKLLVAATVIYLVWRLIQMASWVVT